MMVVEEGTAGMEGTEVAAALAAEGKGEMVGTARSDR